MSDSNGAWPTAPVALERGAPTTRTLVVFNDTFQGTRIDVTERLGWRCWVSSIYASGSVPRRRAPDLRVPLFAAHDRGEALAKVWTSPGQRAER